MIQPLINSSFFAFSLQRRRKHNAWGVSPRVDGRESLARENGRQHVDVEEIGEELSRWALCKGLCRDDTEIVPDSRLGVGWSLMEHIGFRPRSRARRL